MFGFLKNIKKNNIKVTFIAKEIQEKILKWSGELNFMFETPSFSYSFVDKIININEELIKTDDYKKINNLLNNEKDTVEIIILHEVSHAIHHQNMYEENYNNFNGFINLQTKFDNHLLSKIPSTIKHNYNKAQINLENFLVYEKNNPI